VHYEKNNVLIYYIYWKTIKRPGRRAGKEALFGKENSV
jgi:hypothetical protein